MHFGTKDILKSNRNYTFKQIGRNKNRNQWKKLIKGGLISETDYFFKVFFYLEIY